MSRLRKPTNTLLPDVMSHSHNDDLQLSEHHEYAHLPQTASALAEKVLGLAAIGRRTGETETVVAKESRIAMAIGVRYGIHPDEEMLRRRISSNDKNDPTTFMLYSFSPDVSHTGLEIPIAIVARFIPGQPSRVVVIDSKPETDTTEQEFGAWTFIGKNQNTRRIKYEERRVKCLIQQLDYAAGTNEADYSGTST